jgi:Calx-beta domain/HlyD family secretion protein
MTRNRKLVIGAIVVVAVVAGIFLAMPAGSSSNPGSETAIFSKVATRDLQNTVAITGTLAHKSIRNVTAAGQGLVSSVTSTDGSVTRAGQTMFALNGRNAVAEQGSLPFFRSLAPGDQGADVLQLKQILTAAGDYPGPLNNYFNQQTQFALAQWQAQHHYPNSTPATTQAVTVSLEQGTGYQVGAASSAPLTIGPPPAQTTSDVRTRAGSHRAVLAADIAHVAAPTLTIQSVSSQVSDGMAATFVVSASQAPSSAITVNLQASGTAGSQSVVTPPQSVTLEAGATAASVPVQTRATTTVGPNTVLTMAIAGGSGYSVGSPASASTTIENNALPSLSITGGTTVAPGASTTLTVTASQAPIQNTQVVLSFAGSASPGTAYNPVDPIVTIAAGTTSTTVTVNTLASTTIQPASYIVASLEPSSTYGITANKGSTVITINGSTQQPVVTLTSATTYLEKGQPYVVSVGLSEATSTPVTIQLSYQGSAQQGTDYTLPSGPVVIPAGETSTEVSIPTVTDNTVEANTVLTIGLASSAGYQVGNPSSASVTITSSVLPMLTISSNTSTIAQGGAASFTITANQAPTKNTSVSFAVEGTAQAGQNYVPVAGSALLAAGQTQVTVTLQSLQTNIQFEPTDMIVGSWPTRVGTVNVKAGDTVEPGEAILSLTEPDLSVTLQASAANRTQLKVGQACTVQISGENNQANGVITELDSNPTSVASGGTGGQSSQVYEGKIEVSGLNGVDGSQVSVNVITQQVNNALTVPIAAVKQNGTGGDVVRVVNLAKGGAITEVPVTTGLTEGSYIQVTGGLRAGQLVIVNVTS